MREPESKPRLRPRAKRIKSTGGQFTISDELWALMEPLLAEHRNTHRFDGGRPRVSDRRCADAIFFVLRTGCQWNAFSATKLCASKRGWPTASFCASGRRAWRSTTHLT
ncbi:MAG: transposase, partial [Rhodospirillales bacterium]|nr:transposase [Acetobacter sp.]